MPAVAGRPPGQTRDGGWCSGGIGP